MCKWFNVVMERYEVECCVTGFHVYKDCWAPAIGEELRCQ